jgi:single-strand DNA-binding protein
MNSFNGVGRLTRDPEIRYTQGEKPVAIARFSIAINRRFAKEGEQNADFINCVAFGKTAEFLEKFFKKGMAIGVTGRIQTGSYTNKDGAKVYTTEVACESVEFVEKKGDGNSAPAGADNAFMNVPDNITEELPFN